MQNINKQVILTDSMVSKTINRMVTEILERMYNLDDLVIIGLQTRGVFLAKRIADKIKKLEKKNIEVGTLDISLYRDDFGANKKNISLKETDFPFQIDNKRILLIDDVLFTGRSIRAAIECIMDFGRPKEIKLGVLIDRGHRELPIQPDFVGKKFITTDLVSVNLKEFDGKDSVLILNSVEC